MPIPMRKDEYISPVSYHWAPVPNKEMVEYVLKYQGGDEQMMEKILRHNAGFVHQCAVAQSPSGYMIEDLIAEGTIAMIKAAKKFDSSLGYHFITYAVWWIKQAMRSYKAKHFKCLSRPDNVPGDVGHVRKVREQYYQEHGRMPRQEMITQIINNTRSAKLPAWTDERTRLASKDNREPLYIDHPPHNGNKKAFPGNQLRLEQIPLPVPPAYTLDDRIAEQNKESIRQAMVRLSERERKIVQWHYGLDGGEGRTLEAIGQDLGITRERTRQIRNVALDKIKRALANV